jgi:hypothetical protein
MPTEAKPVEAKPVEAKLPLGVIYITTMSRPDAALALAMLYGFQGKRESRMGSVCVTGAGLDAAIFCDIVQRFYTLGPVRNANEVLPPGLAVADPMPANPAMVKTAVAGSYPRSLKKVCDTSLAEAVIRNGVIFNAEAVMILSAPATSLAKSLDLQGTRELYKERVKLLVVVDSGSPQDAPAMQKVLSEFPSPIVFCGKEVGDALRYPAASIAKDFAWAEAGHPVVDAYRTYQPMPYDAPAYDMAAVFYAVRPESGLFSFSGSGAGKARSLIVDPAKNAAIMQSFVEIASAKPVPPVRRTKPQA